MQTSKTKQEFDLSGAFKKTLLAFAIAMCFVWSQIAGWSVTGTMLADYGQARQVAATGTSVAAENLQQKRAERKAIGTPRPIGEIEADLDLELRKTSKTYPKGDGPNATKLRGELASANRALALDAEINAAVKRLEAAPAVAEGDVDTTIPVGIAQRVGGLSQDATKEEVEAWKRAASENVHFWFIVFVVFATAFFATFGFALIGVSHDDISPALLREKPVVWVPLIFLLVEAGMNATFGYRRAGGGIINPAAWLQAAMFFGVAILGAYLPTRWGTHDAPKRTSEEDAFIQSMTWGPPRLSYGGQHLANVTPPDVPQPAPIVPPMPGRPNLETWPDRGSQSSPHVTTPNSITVNLMGTSAPQPLVPVQQAQQPARALENFAPQHPQLAGPAAAHKPIDRSAVSALADHLLAFRAACVDDCPGSSITGDELERRYLAWAGDTARTPVEFRTMFPIVTGLMPDMLGGHAIFNHVTLREHVRLGLVG